MGWAARHGLDHSRRNGDGPCALIGASMGRSWVRATVCGVIPEAARGYSKMWFSSLSIKGIIKVGICAQRWMRGGQPLRRDAATSMECPTTSWVETKRTWARTKMDGTTLFMRWPRTWEWYWLHRRCAGNERLGVGNPSTWRVQTMGNGMGRQGGLASRPEGAKSTAMGWDEGWVGSYEN